MALDTQIKAQLQQYLTMLEGDLVLKVSAGDDKASKDMLDLVNEIGSMSSRITVEKTQLERTPSFSVNKVGSDSGVVFAGLPLGHEFTSLVLALLQVSGRAPKVDESVVKRIQAIKEPMHFDTFVSLTCHNCPDVVQALNIMSVLNPNITHSMVEGGTFQDEVKAKDIMAVPTVFLNGESFASGRMEIEDILNKLGSKSDGSEFADVEPFEVLVVGGGPAGASAAIYTARKGIRTGIVAERFGGQVNDTLSIENIIGLKATEGPQFVSSLEGHVAEYDIEVMKSQRAASIARNDEMVEVTLENGAVLKSKTVILSTGTRYRQLGVPGEQEFKNKGVAYCPHCDGPIFKGKNVAVVGGGNSGVEAAIDLAGIVNHVTLIQHRAELKADKVLQERLYSLPNVTVLLNASTQEITGTDKVNGLTYLDKATGETHHVELEGVFIQIGLLPNTEFLQGTIDLNLHNEVIVDKHGATSMPGVFAAGDCTDSVYKQIVISMGSGATAALGAFDYLIRNTASTPVMQ